MRTVDVDAGLALADHDVPEGVVHTRLEDVRCPVKLQCSLAVADADVLLRRPATTVTVRDQVRVDWRAAAGLTIIA